jgi:hypothetical protein
MLAISGSTFHVGTSWKQVFRMAIVRIHIFQESDAILPGQRRQIFDKKPK